LLLQAGDDADERREESKHDCAYDYGEQVTLPEKEWTWNELTWKEAKARFPYDDDLLNQFEKGASDVASRQAVRKYIDDYLAGSNNPDSEFDPSAKAWFATNQYKSVWNPYLTASPDFYHPVMIPDVRMPWFMLGVV
jgi:hypothetical protein